MNIVFVTYLSNNKWAGPNNSVPKQILAQSKYDNVCWINLSNNYDNDQDVKNQVIYKNFSKTNKDIFSELPDPFNNPDFVIFEGVYFYKYIEVSRECTRKEIPYIIIPRSSLTEAGQKSKKMKKKLGNLLFFNKFIKNAASIQYLTKRELLDSGLNWNSDSFIIPNGIGKQLERRFVSNNHNDILKGAFIGRADIYQKGLDLMIEAISTNKGKFINEIFISLYCPSSKDKIKLEKMIEHNELGDMIKLNESVFEAEKFKVLEESDFFIQTSRFEGHSMGLIEALSFGVPCIVTEGTNIAEELEIKNAGWHAGNNKESIANALIDLIDNRENLEKKSKAAYNLSLEYSWDKIGKLSSLKYKEISRISEI